MDSNYKYSEFTLENGLRVAIQPTSSKRTYARLFFNQGSISESKGEEGLAHFFEHIMFKSGSTKYTTEDVQRIRESIPYTNAFTNVHQMSFIGGFFPNQTELFFDFLTNNLFDQSWDQRAIDQERQRVLREISDRKSKPDFKDYQDFKSKVYRNNVHNYFVLGNEDVIRKASKEKFQRFHAKIFSPDIADLILVGTIPEDVDRLIDKYFSGLQSKNLTRFEYPKVGRLEEHVILQRPAPDLFNREHPEESDCKLEISMITEPLQSEDSAAIQMLAYLLGEKQNSRIFNRVSEQMGAAYHIHGGYNGFSNCGLFNIHGLVHSKRQEEVLDAIFDEIYKSQHGKISSQELQDLNSTAIFDLSSVHETLSNFEYDLTDLILQKFREGVSYEDYMKRISKVTPEDIKRVANLYLPSSLNDNNYVLMIRDPLKK